MQTQTTPMTDVDQLRHKFLEFFEGKGHLIHPPASLKSDDAGLMFNVAGMQQFKPYFQGATPSFPGVPGVHPRVVTAQKCMRAGGKDSDIENVGVTRRHHTFFEMLGNFSFGDYFKREAIIWAWEFLTSPAWLGLEPDRLYVTMFTDDDEAHDIWANEVGVPKARISRWGEAENFWPANAITDEREGPCGPCSEIFYDRGPEFGSSDETGPNTGSGDRYLEIGNLVFTQFDLQADGELKPLPQKNIDTGFGLERLATVVTGAKDAYATSLFQPIIGRLVELSGVPYEDIKSVHHRIIADHLRSITFAINDGILPANDGAGYVIKMLIRRASRQVYLLGLEEPVLFKLVDGVVEAMAGGYPELRDARERIKAIIKTEETQFLRTLETGIVRVGQLLDELEGNILAGEVAFDLWQTYGFPLDLTEDMAQERGVNVDRQGYRAAREKAQEASRGGKEQGALFTTSKDILGTLAREYGETEFLGYTRMDAAAEVLELIHEAERLSEANEGQHLQIILDGTPFYAEGGGQIGDAGKLEWSGGAALISRTSKSKEGLFLHHGSIIRGTLKPGAKVNATVDPSRCETEKHHSATHLLHAALRSVLGEHVAQAGSLVAPDHLRFDFSHGGAIGVSELEQIETRVNRWVQANFQVNWQVVPLEQARQAGAMMLFGEKYGEQVRLVSMGGDVEAVSKELCGGTHVPRTGDIGPFIITSESAVSAGVRRIEALVGMAAVKHVRDLRDSSNALAKQLGVQPAELAGRIDRLQRDLKAQGRDIQQLRDKLAAAQTSSNASEVKEAAGFSYAVSQLTGLDATALRNAADNLLDKSKADIVVLASGNLLVTKVSQAGQDKGAHAGKLIRELATRAGGGGGGRPDMAQAGIKDESKISGALESLPDILAEVEG